MVPATENSTCAPTTLLRRDFHGKVPQEAPGSISAQLPIALMPDEVSQ